MGLFASCLKAPKKTNQHCGVLAGEVWLQFESKHGFAFCTSDLAVTYAKERHPRLALVLRAIHKVYRLFIACRQSIKRFVCAVAMRHNVFVVFQVLLISVEICCVLVFILVQTNVYPFDSIFTE